MILKCVDRYFKRLEREGINDYDRELWTALCKKDDIITLNEQHVRTRA